MIYKKIDTRLNNVEMSIKNKFENLKFIISEKKFIQGVRLSESN